MLKEEGFTDDKIERFYKFIDTSNYFNALEVYFDMTTEFGSLMSRQLSVKKCVECTWEVAKCLYCLKEYQTAFYISKSAVILSAYFGQDAGHYMTNSNIYHEQSKEIGSILANFAHGEDDEFLNYLKGKNINYKCNKILEQQGVSLYNKMLEAFCRYKIDEEAICHILDRNNKKIQNIIYK